MSSSDRSQSFAIWACCATRSGSHNAPQHAKLRSHDLGRQRVLRHDVARKHHPPTKKIWVVSKGSKDIDRLSIWPFQPGAVNKVGYFRGWILNRENARRISGHELTVETPRPCGRIGGCNHPISQRRRWESNPCTGLCRPLPKPLGHVARPKTLPACLARPSVGGQHREMQSFSIARRWSFAVAALVLTVSACTAETPSAAPTDPCQRRADAAALAIDIDETVELLDIAMEICDSLTKFETAFAQHPGFSAIRLSKW